MKSHKQNQQNDNWQFASEEEADPYLEETKPSDIYPFIGDDEFPIEIVTLEEYEQRLARAIWIKGIYQNKTCPQEIFTLILNADISPGVLEHWCQEGGLEYVLELCEGLFPTNETTEDIEEDEG